MKSRDFSSWIWGDALALMHHAERMQRQVLQSVQAAAHAWEPPVDIVESDSAVLVIVALPGVSADDVVVRFDPEGITVTGLRPIPYQLHASYPSTGNTLRSVPASHPPALACPRAGHTAPGRWLPVSHPEQA
ncbi:hypothetical protein [Bordetella holmesii]|uniref:hypothetical protein n=1 Tax=Bordetella holmesii TaxID=35814 RepID=UPI0004B6F6FB|nr:hypothetical protein [Bordetella holmesii]